MKQNGAPTETDRAAPVSVFPRLKLHFGCTFMNNPG